MKTDHFYIKDSPYFYGGELVQISSFNKEDLKIDKKKDGKILLFITIIMLIDNCVYQLTINLDIFQKKMMKSF